MTATRYLLRNGPRGKTDTLTELKGYLERSEDGNSKACTYQPEDIASSPSKLPAPPPEEVKEEAAADALVKKEESDSENELLEQGALQLRENDVHLQARLEGFDK